MRSIYYKHLTIVLIIIIASFEVKAQKTIPLFFEKAYLHTDRSTYSAGERIWFKAYMINAKTHASSSMSNNLYVELFSPNASLIKRNTIRVDHGLGEGDFTLGDSIPAGTYHIRAYTNWMKNFGNHFFFEKDITVVAVINKMNTNKASLVGVKTIQKNSQINKDNTIQFFPEGGSLLANTKSYLAFKALNNIGNSIDASGSIISDEGDTIQHFSTSFSGMGKCLIQPKSNTDYKAIVQFKDGTTQKVDLPSVYAEGYNIATTLEDTNIVIHIFTNASTIQKNTTKEITLVARNTGKILYKEKILITSDMTIVKISQHLFPTGIAAITVYDAQLKPNAERLVFIENKNNSTHIQVTTDKNIYQSKEKVIVAVKTTDAYNNPISANLSLSAFDDGNLNSSNSNLLSYILLESEIKGNIENPANYFDEKNNDRAAQIDLLLQTQGWRSFLWRQLAETNVAIKYLPETGIGISGYVKEVFGKAMMPNMNVTLLAPGAKGSKLYFTKTDSTGHYFLDGLPLYGTQSIKINSKNDKGKKGGILMLNTPDTSIQNDYIQRPFEQTPALAQFATEAKRRYEIESKFTNKDMTLPDYIAKSTSQTTVSRDGTVENNFGYSFAAQVNPSDKQFGTLENYLIHKTSAIADVENEGVNYQVNGKLVRPRFIVDNREDVFERIDYYAIPIDQVISVKLNQVVGFAGEGLIDRIVIRITLKPGAYNNDLSLLLTDIDGYYETKTFYVPTYLLANERLKKDVRTTIFWEPTITTNEQGEATLSFYNADPASTIKISVQGIADKGLINGGTTYMVK
jgi:hypothetical protein